MILGNTRNIVFSKHTLSKSQNKIYKYDNEEIGILK